MVFNKQGVLQILNSFANCFLCVDAAGFDFQRMREAEVAEIPPSGGFSSEEKDKIPSTVYATIPKEYVKSLPGIGDGFFGAMQSLVDICILYRVFTPIP